MRSLGAIAAAVFAMAIAGRAHAFQCTQGSSNDFVSIYWTTRLIPVAFRGGASTTIPSEALDRILRDSFNAWTSASCSDIEFEFRPIVADDPPYDSLLCEGKRSEKTVFDKAVGLDQVSQVVIVHDCWTEDHDSSVLALTTMTYGARDGVIRYGVIEINERRSIETQGFAFEEVTSQPSCRAQGDVFDLAAVVTHEVGHFLGLGHTDMRGLTVSSGDRPTMTAIVDPCDTDFATISADDLDGLCYIYPRGQGARQCLPLPEQETPYITTVAFGCQSTPGGGGDVLVSGLLGLLCAMTCSKPRSRR